MTVQEFIQTILIDEIGSMVHKERHHFISFAVIGLGIEFVGSCLDDKPFEQEQLSGKRFRKAIKELFPARYHGHMNALHGLRNGFAHQFRPGGDVVLTHAEEAVHFGHAHLQRDSRNLLALVAEEYYADFAEACLSVIAKADTGLLDPKVNRTFLHIDQ